MKAPNPFHAQNWLRTPRRYNRAMAEEAEKREKRTSWGYSEGRKLWTSAEMTVRAIVYSRPIKGSWHEESDVVDLVFSVYRNPKNYRLRLTSMRPDELEVLKQAIDAAFDLARPVVARNWAVEVRHLQETGDPSAAMYRAEPRLLTKDDFNKGLINDDLLRHAGDTALFDADDRYGAKFDDDDPEQ